VTEDLREATIRYSSFPLNPDQLQEFFNLDKQERIELVQKVDRELGSRKLTAGFIHECKRELFQDKCETGDLN
jgi:hypothetical protein